MNRTCPVSEDLIRVLSIFVISCTYFNIHIRNICTVTWCIDVLSSPNAYYVTLTSHFFERRVNWWKMSLTLHNSSSMEIPHWWSLKLLVQSHACASGTKRVTACRVISLCPYAILMQNFTADYSWIQRFVCRFIIIFKLPGSLCKSRVCRIYLLARLWSKSHCCCFFPYV